MIMNLVKMLGAGKTALTVIIALSASQAASIYFLKQTYDKAKEMEHSAEQWQYASQIWSEAYQQIDQQLLARDLARDKLAAENKQLHKELSEIEDETETLDQRMPDDLIRLLTAD